jgi:hypothetical protein
VNFFIPVLDDSSGLSPGAVAEIIVKQGDGIQNEHEIVKNTESHLTTSFTEGGLSITFIVHQNQ